MSPAEPSIAQQRRHLLPRQPSDRVVVGVMIAGAVAALALEVDPIVGLAPGALLALVQKVNGHVQAWRSGGVERAFVMESAAISFYVVVVALAVAAVIQAAGVVDHVEVAWLAFGALWVDTLVRSWRESRFA